MIDDRLEANRPDSCDRMRTWWPVTRFSVATATLVLLLPALLKVKRVFLAMNIGYHTPYLEAASLILELNLAQAPGCITDDDLQDIDTPLLKTKVSTLQQTI